MNHAPGAGSIVESWFSAPFKIYTHYNVQNIICAVWIYYCNIFLFIVLVLLQQTYMTDGTFDRKWQPLHSVRRSSITWNFCTDVTWHTEGDVIHECSTEVPVMDVQKIVIYPILLYCITVFLFCIIIVLGRETTWANEMIWNESCARCRIDHLTCWQVV